MKKLFIACLFSVSFSVSALTVEQKDLLRPVILAEPSIQTYLTNGQDGFVAAWLNSPSTFIVWRTELTEKEIIENDGFNFTLVDGLPAGKRDEWSNFLFRLGTCDPSKPNIRAAFIDVWSGTTAKNAVQSMIIELSKRFATQAEKVLATGAGTTQTPGQLTFDGDISETDVVEILRGD